MTWAGAGQAERVGRTWTDSGTNYAATYTWSMLGLSGYRNTGIDEPTKTTSVTTWIVRAPDGTPVAQRYTNGSEYYYLFDGQGDVVGLEDPGTMQAAYDFCPTGNEADLASTVLAAVALGNPLRQGSEVYDDLTKDYFGTCGCITEDDSGTSTQGPAFTFGANMTGVVVGAAFVEGPTSWPPPVQTGPFIADEPGVAATATAIDQAYPNAVRGLTLDYFDANTLSPRDDLDIVTQNYIIQVKTGDARHLGGQIKTARAYFPSMTVIGFAPDLPPYSGRLRAFRWQGLPVYTDLPSLIQAIGQGNGP